jgi:hypothetical protein
MSIIIFSTPPAEVSPNHRRRLVAILGDERLGLPVLIFVVLAIIGCLFLQKTYAKRFYDMDLANETRKDMTETTR